MTPSASPEIALLALLSLATLLPFVVAAGTCFVKFSIVLVLVRNALGIQQVPSNLTLNGIALLLSLFVMMPVAQRALQHLQSVPFDPLQPAAVARFVDEGLGDYKDYLRRYAERDLVAFFERAQAARQRPARAAAGTDDGGWRVDAAPRGDALSALLPAYALTEITQAFRIGFYLYLPFVVIDLVVRACCWRSA